MADLNERVARVEEQADAHIRTMDYLRKDMSDLRHSIDALSAELRDEIGSLRDELRGEMSALRDNVDRKLNWLIGLVVTTCVATIGALAGTLWAVLQVVR